MKITKYIAALGISLLVMTACESDLEKITFNADTATAAALNIDGTAQDLYTLNANAGSETVFNLKWTKPDMGYPASLSNVLQIDLKDKNFSKASMVDAFTDATSYSFVTSNLNSNIQTLLKKYEMETQQVSVELRIASVISASADTVFSNVLTVNVMPYEGEPEYPAITLRGDYSGWDFNKSQKVYSVNSDNMYAGMVYFDGKAQNGWKFCGSEDWSTDNWGAPEGMTAEQSPVTLVSGSNTNITAYSKNSYYFEFNNTTGELKVSKAYNAWGIVGDHNGWGSGDTVMSLATETDESNKFQHYLTATMDMAAGNKWKIRPDEKWENDVAPGNIEGEFEDAGDGNFKVTEAGSYTIKWYFNKVTPRLVVTKNK